jgi:hypothetical protein
MFVYEAVAKMHALFWNKTVALNCTEYARDYSEPYWNQVFPFVYKASWPVWKDNLIKYDIEHIAPKWAFKFGELLMDTETILA